MPEQANECNSQKDSVLFDLIVNEIEEGMGLYRLNVTWNYHCIILI